MRVVAQLFERLVGDLLPLKVDAVGGVAFGRPEHTPAGLDVPIYKDEVGVMTAGVKALKAEEETVAGIAELERRMAMACK
jgi:hypothetical protein